MRFWLVLLCTLVWTVACSRPQPPTFRPSLAEVLDNDKSGMIVRVHAAAHNPNGFVIPIKSARGTLYVEEVDTGEATVTAPTSLAAHADTPVTLDVKVPWKRVAYAVGKAKPESVVHYRFKGSATVDAGGATVEIPIEQTGEVDKKTVFLAAVRHIGLPKDLRAAPRLHSE